jgi:hypothetical protein
VIHLIPGGARLDPAQFLKTDAVVVVVGAAGAAQNAVSVPVAALTGAIPSGTILDFGANKFARLTSTAAAGATALAVSALPTALVNNDTATYPGSPLTKATVPGGTLVGRTYAERDAGTGYGPAGAADDEIFLVAFDVTDVSINPDVDLVRHNSVIRENFLPAVSRNATNLPLVRARYRVTKGAN